MNVKELFNLENKVAVVTGALGLLGKQHCSALSEAGAHIIVCDLDEAKCQEFSDSLGNDSMGAGVNITDIHSVNNVKEKILTKYKHIDILVNNAAINDMFECPTVALEFSRFENYPLHMFQNSLNVNITGAFICSQVLGTVMANAGKGSIINIASTYGLVAPDQSIYKDEQGNQKFYKSAAYPVTKGAILAFSKFLAAYWGSKGVRVNSLSPGGVENNQDQFFIKNYSAKTPLGRMAHPTDFKGAILFLASDASCYMTGANLIVDGGWTTW